MYNYGLDRIIKEKRIEKGLSQRELARRCEVNNSLISRIEDAKIAKPNFLVLKKLAEILELDMLELLVVSNYSTKEIEDLGYINVKNFVGLAGINIVKSYFTNYKCYDIIKILRDYKKGNLTEQELLGMIYYIGNVNLLEKLAPELQKKYNIETLIIEKKEE